MNQKIKNGIYDAFEIELEHACKDDEMYDLLMGERSTKAAFELGAKYMLKVFSYPLTPLPKQGATESDKEYIGRLEDILVEYSCSNNGWRHAFTGK